MKIMMVISSKLEVRGETYQVGSFNFRERKTRLGFFFFRRKVGEDE
jgi:hypothetical protein